MATKITAAAGFYLDRESLTYFTSKNSEVPAVPLTAEVVQNLHIVSEPALERVLRAWVEHTRVVPSTLVLLVSEGITFSLDLTDPSVTESTPEVQSFLELVPFNEVQSKIFRLESGVRVVAVNRNLIEPLVSVLEKMGFTVVCVTTGFVMGMDEQAQFTPEIGQKTLSSPDVLLRYNLLSETEIIAKVAKPEPFLSVKIDKKVVAMLLVFLVLLSVLGFLLWSQ